MTSDNQLYVHIEEILLSDDRITQILNIVSQFSEHPLYLSGGIIRNTIWDHIFELERKTPFNDVDIIYLDLNHTGREDELKIERFLSSKDSSIPWSVRNQCRMAQKHGHPMYRSISEALSYWVETATAIAYGPVPESNRKIIAPYGLSDLMEGIVRPSDESLRVLMMERAKAKNWAELYPGLIYR